MTSATEYMDILRTVTAWPVTKRMELARDVLSSVSGASLAARSSFERARGIGRRVGETPTDTEVRQWIEQHRAEKYG